MFPFRGKKTITCVNETVSNIIAMREQDVKGGGGGRHHFFGRRAGWAAEEVA